MFAQNQSKKYCPHFISSSSKVSLPCDNNSIPFPIGTVIAWNQFKKQQLLARIAHASKMVWRKRFTFTAAQCLFFIFFILIKTALFLKLRCKPASTLRVCVLLAETSKALLLNHF